MKRDELLDNLFASWERGETVTLTLAPHHANMPAGETELRGQILAIARHWSGRRTLQVVLTSPDLQLPEVIGLTMIRNFRVGR